MGVEQEEEYNGKENNEKAWEWEWMKRKKRRTEQKKGCDGQRR